MKKLYIKQKVFKVTDHYDITDAAGSITYKVDEEFKFFGHTMHVRDKQDTHLFTIQKEIWAWLPTFYVQFIDGRNLTLKSRLSFMKRKIEIDPEGANLYLEGDIWDHNFTLYENDTILGSIDKAFLSWGDTYELSIFDERQQDLIVAIIIAVDHMIDEEQAANNGG